MHLRRLTASHERRIDELLAALTLPEKVSLCHAGSKFAANAVPRLGIPELTMSDGPHGVRQEINRDSWDPAGLTTDHGTYLPTGTALAATWNPRLARRFGEVLGAEARHRGKDIILGPGINIVRTPLCGRNFEYYSEDPHLIARLVAPVVRSIQRQGTAACVKHYAANSQELNRGAVDAVMDERTLREIYLPGFRAAIVEGGCLTLMGAYNRFRGQHCCHNDHLLHRILKQEWGFQGAVISDWAGAHDTFEAARFGLDLEMGTGARYDDYFLAGPFRRAVEAGLLPEALVNDKARRLLRVMLAVGVLDAPRRPGARNTRRHQRAALEIAREAIVLLKNEPAVLPLRREALRRVVVVGANAEVRHCQGGNSSAVKALYEVTPLEGLRNRLGKGVQLDYFPGYPAEGGDGLPIAGEYLGIADAGAGTRGWRGRYFNNREAVGAPALVRADADLDFDWRGSAPTPGGRPMEYQVSWESTLTPPQSGTYEFQLEGAEHACFNLAGQPLVWRWECGGPDVVSKSIELEGGRAYDVSVWLKPNHDQVRLRLRWFPPWQPRRAAGRRADEAVEAARGADAVVFCGGLDHQYDVEGCDRRSLALPDGQDELIARLAAANPRTVVALVGGSPMAMPWLERVPAVVLLWYAGMEAGNALADVLLGRANPSGKLPFTFPRRLEDSPAHALDDYQFARCDYKEGVFVGYRWFDARGLEPLFPFGHGLSYTTFELSDPQVATRGKGRAWRAEVACTLRNTGAVTGAEVVQLYVEDREASLPRPPRELKGFEKVLLDPGETRRLTFRLTPDDLAFYDPAAGRWVAEPGAFTANLGTSSRRLPLQAPFTFPG